MGKVLQFRRRRHARNRSVSAKSAAVTASPVARRIATASPRESQTLPRLNRDTVVLEHSPPACRIISAISSSSSPLAIMKSESCIPDTVRWAHNEVKADCAQGAVVIQAPFVHDVHMQSPAKKLRARVPKKEPQQWTVTYLKDWRRYRNLSLEAVAAELGLHHSQLSRIERGINQYTQYHLETLARVYKTSIWALLYCRPDASPDEVVALFQRSIKPQSNN